MIFKVPEMSCGHCQQAIEQALAALDGDAVVAVDLSRREVQVQTAQSEQAVQGALDAIGFASEALR